MEEMRLRKLDVTRVRRIGQRPGLARTLLACSLLAVLPVSAIAAPKNAERANRAPASTNSEIPEEARLRYERAVQLYNEGDPEGALVEFERAYKISPTYRLLYNIGSIRLQLNDYAEALKAFQGYLAGGGNEIVASRRTEVEKHIASLKGRVGSVLVTSNVNGAEVSVDDAVVGTTPLNEAMLLNPGQRRITITRGAWTRSRMVTVAGQDSLVIELNLETPPPALMPLASSAPAPPPSPSRAPAYFLWGLGGAFAVGATVVGVLSLGAMHDLDEERNSSPTTRAELDAAESKMKNLALATDILIGAAVVTGSAALYFTLQRPSDEKKQFVRAGLAPNGVKLEGRF